MKVGLYFGSFNPIHIGHLIIANYVAEHTNVDQVWLIVSPQNPLKPTSSLLNEYQRLHLVQLAIDNNEKLKASDVEFKMPKPSFTIDTIVYLEEKYPNHQFYIILGSDSFNNISKWKNADVLQKNYPLIIYQRPGFITPNANNKNLTILNAPLLDISATTIRKLIKMKKSIRYLVTDNVLNDIEKNGYYR
jgi:nicotinate-nucleotide adenylyltransferase